MATHRCFACDDNNPERIVTRDGDHWTFQFVERFVGPRGRAHGGTAIGALTCPALQLAERDGMRHPVPLSVTGRLHFPVPLASPVQVNALSEEGQCRLELHVGSDVFLSGFVNLADREVEPGTLLQQPTSKDANDLRALSELANADLKGPTFLTQFMRRAEQAGIPWDPPPICFGCSETEMALKLRTRIPKPGHLWTKWGVESGFTDGNGRLSATMAAAALDCSTLWVITANDLDESIRLLRERKMWVTGTYGVHFLRVPPFEIEGGYRVAARFLGSEGRKSLTMSVLLDQEGTVYAVGKATSILIDLPEGWMP